MGFIVSSQGEESPTKQVPKAQTVQQLSNVQRGFLSIGQIANRYGLPKSTVHHWCTTGKLAAIPKPYGSKMTYQISPQAVEMLLAQMKEEIPSKGPPFGT